MKLSLRDRQAGIGLPEVLIGLTLAVVVMAGIMQIYVSSRRNYALQDGLTGLQESVRFAVQTIQGDAHMAGYRGCLRDIGTVINTLTNPDDFLWRFDEHVEGFNANGNAWSPGLPDTLDDANPANGTDVLTLRVTSDTGVVLASTMASSTADLQITSGLNPGTLAAKSTALISDCGGAAIFEVASVDTATGVVTHGENFSRRFLAGSQIFTVQTVSYFIAPSNADPDRSSLWRRVADADPQELAEGVENLQVLYGFDDDGDQVPDTYRSADDIGGDWDKVVSLRVALLVASVRERVADAVPQKFTLLDEEDVNPFAAPGVNPDGRLRRVLTFTVALRNRLS